MVRLTDRPDMTLDVYRGRKTTMQQQQQLLDTIRVIFSFLFDLANTLTKYVPPYIVVYLVKVFVIATAFQEFTFIVNYCPFTSAFGACSL